MRHVFTFALVAVLSASPVLAQSDNSSEEDGFNLMEEGAKLFFKGIMQEMEPALKELEGLADEFEPALRDFAQQMGPALRDLLKEVEDWSVYHPPEILPNGDIILRRKTPDELDPDEPATNGEIDL